MVAARRGQAGDLVFDLENEQMIEACHQIPRFELEMKPGFSAVLSSNF
jgi:hypothetical protein